MTDRRRAALYSRVSTIDQATEESISLKAQTEDMEHYCEAQGLTIVDQYQDIESGTKATRRDFQRMLADAKRGRFDTIVCWKIDRLSRGLYPAARLMEVVEAHGITLQAVKDTIDLKTFGLMAAVGKIEIDNFKERSRMGKQGRAKQGRVPCGVLPYGYRTGSNGKPEIDEEQAKVIRQLFAMYISPARYTVPYILETLRMEYGFQLSRGHLYNLLGSRAYIGTWTFEGIEVPAPCIIDDATFAKAQQTKKDKLTRAPAGSTKPVYLLEGLLRCANCGRRVVARTRRERRASGPQVKQYYRCTGYTPACRPRPYIQASLLEKKVWHEIADVLRRPDLVVDRFNITEAGDALEDDIKVASKEVARWIGRKERLVSLFVSEAIDRSEFDHQLRFIQEPAEAAETHLANLKHRQGQQDASTEICERFLASAKMYADNLADMDLNARQELLRTVIASATLDYDNQTRYRLNVPAAPRIYASSAEAAEDGRILSDTSAWT